MHAVTLGAREQRMSRLAQPVGLTTPNFDMVLDLACLGIREAPTPLLPTDRGYGTLRIAVQQSSEVS
jgi:hypothetical protein